ncbi:DUF1214 domain-containing protein [Sphingomonas sp. ERG5]|uniref:DUF1214 domain-containing protein n=1 Tax=Sphingomonas sp. ERG5 TaxID=1381597 RepID=UPI000690658B|nr:DUF1214 domain-containing protein [Sphingomonas sp. ERG5]
MWPWARYAITGVAGILIGAGGAVWSVRAGALGSATSIGPWTTGKDYGTAAASAKTRAVVALRGLLALPATETRYYNAATDDAGRPLDGKCRYLVMGGALPVKWWSLTLYDPQGYLVANPANIWSIGSAALPAAEQGQWLVTIAPDKQVGYWLPTGRPGRFELTLRAYLPADRGAGDFTRDQLPSIVREGCA